MIETNNGATLGLHRLLDFVVTPDHISDSTFNDGDIRIIGKVQYQGRKQYICTCARCAQDPELNGDSVWVSPLRSLTSGHLPCSCSSSPRRTPGQWKVLIRRAVGGRFEVSVPDAAKSSSRVDCMCPKCNHHWDVSVSSLCHCSYGCPNCARMRRRMDVVTAATRIKTTCADRGYTFRGFDGDWSGSETRANMECAKGHTWSVSFAQLTGSASGCPECSPTAMMMDDVADSNVRHECQLRNCTFDGFDGKWVGVKTRVNLICGCGHSWSPMYTNFVNSKIGCPRCSSGGYQISSPGYFYLYRWSTPTHAFLKYGITNDLDRRLLEQSDKTMYTPTLIVAFRSEVGQIPIDIESAVDELKVRTSTPNQVDRCLFSDGYTETLPVSMQLDVLQIVSQFMAATKQ